LAKNSTDAGQLIERVAFDKKGAASDGLGGTTATWAEQFQRRAGFTHLRGGETVLAARLEGTHTIVIRVRSSTETRTVTTDWRARDVRTGTIYNIKDITPTEDRMFLDILAQSGVAA
jgi:SPP1 family predicted phage head-tail adaptor